MEKFLKRKGIGFYLTLCVAVLAIVTAVIYAVSYANYAGQMSWLAFGLLIGGAVCAVALHCLGKGNWAPWVLAAAIFVSVLLYIQCMYNYVVVVMVGIDLNSFSPQFITCSVLLCVSLVLSIVNIYLKQQKEAN